MIQRISGCLGGMIALVLVPLPPVLGIILSCVAAEAGMENARFALDYKPKFVYSKAIPYLCDDPATVTEEPNYSPNYTNTPCASYSVWGVPLGAGQVYVVVAKAGSEGVAAVSFGVTYDGSAGIGIDPNHMTWTPCADGVSFPNNDGMHGDFPQPGGGLRITWNLTSCQTEAIPPWGVHAVVGVFYVYAYSDDVLRLTPNNNLQSGPEAAIANCAGQTTDLMTVWGAQLVTNYMLGRVGFGDKYGWEPCEVLPVSAITWGRVKSMYNEHR